ncbi:PilZ domain-containing protein [Halioxenophilus aromaticivorans]|uniref:PilZ domain-containing protein n=1 Tax=Halioxenophilus aromaticivorans TaxID=1306992 RepID=A0AAV3U275_9ALTE
MKASATEVESIEKRHDLRTYYSCRLVLDHPTLGQYQAVCQDVSDSGVYIALESEIVKPIAVGATVSVRVVSGLPTSKTVNTQVVRADKQGLGLKFIA